IPDDHSSARSAAEEHTQQTKPSAFVQVSVAVSETPRTDTDNSLLHNPEPIISMLDCQGLNVSQSNKDKIQAGKYIELGLLLDNIVSTDSREQRTMQVRIPKDKLQVLTLLLKQFSQQRKITLKGLQTLVGSLNFFSRAVSPGRAFNRRFYQATCKASKPFHLIRITKAMK
ncbi:hypothetical protein KUTeg_015347, partial [Tegillarca granosa]